MKRPTDSQIAAAVAVLLKSRGHASVVRWIGAVQKEAHAAERPTRRRIQVLRTPRGDRVELYQEDVARLSKKETPGRGV